LSAITHAVSSGATDVWRLATLAFSWQFGWRRFAAKGARRSDGATYDGAPSVLIPPPAVQRIFAVTNLKRFRVHNLDRVAPFNSERNGGDRYAPDGFCASFDLEADARAYAELLAASREQQIVIYDVEGEAVSDLGRRSNSLIGGPARQMPDWYLRSS
jgi:hypothetical protein